MRQISRQWTQTNRSLLFIFLTLLILVIILGFVGLSSYLPSLRVYLHVESKPSSQEQAVLNSLRQPLDQLNYNRLFESAKKLAKRSPVLEIGRCNPTPPILKITSNAPQTFRNSDTKPHTLTFTNTTDLVLEPGEQKILTVDFYDYSPGIFIYLCDNLEQRSGALYVTEE